MGLYGSRVEDDRRQHANGHDCSTDHGDLLLDDAPIAPIFYGARTYLIRPEVKGWTPALLGVHRYQTLRLEP